MNLNMKVHPAIAILVVALGIAATGVKIWADGEAKELGGPAQLLRDPSGQVYLQIQNQLLQHDADGNFVQRHDLSVLGVDIVIGAIGFFPNGDILLRRGEDQRSFADNISAYQRKENTHSIITDAPSIGLARCNLITQACSSFATPPIDLQSTFGVVIDQQTDAVFISDTSRHILRKYSASGVELATPAPGFRFPNQLVLDDARLLVADTNNHRISVVDSSDLSFGKILRSIDVVPEEADRRGDRWPSHFAKVGDEWWVNNMKSNMRNGGIYVFDLDWKYMRRIPLPGEADPVSIMRYGAGALISDWDNDRVYYIDESGAALPDLESTGLLAVLEESAAKRRHYQAISWIGILLLAIALTVLIVRALVAPDHRIPS
jgi:hypothetical protein